MLEFLYHNSVLLLKCTVYGWAWTQLEDQSPDQYGGMKNSQTNNTTPCNMVWFRKSAIEIPVTSWELDNGDVDGKTDSTDDETPPNFSIGQ